MDAALLGLGLIVLAILLVIGYGISIFNVLVSIKNQVENGWGQIDIQLKRRHDLIPNLVEVAKDYMDFEQETLQQVIAARSGAMAAKDQSREATIGAEGILGAALGKLFAVVEAYPELKANKNVQRLMEELSSTENRIAFARQHYNDMVMNLNTKIQVFPSNVVAGMFSFIEAPYFEVPEAVAEPVKVDLR